MMFPAAAGRSMAAPRGRVHVTATLTAMPPTTVARAASTDGGTGVEAGLPMSVFAMLAASRRPAKVGAAACRPSVTVLLA